MRKEYSIEREGQIDFFDNYNIDWRNNEVLVDNTDGVYNGNILEFKKNITDLNDVLFQAIKYLSKLRIKGESVPATIMLISLNDTTAYLYKSKDYVEDIHQVYIGAASKNNSGFNAKPYDEKLDYSDEFQSSRIKHLLKNKKERREKYIPIDIDENCIVGWSTRYYRENPNAKKGDFIGDDTGTSVKVIGEIRDPKHFKYLINPYKEKTNEKFKYLMDCLNDRLSKKDLGAFYTPAAYCNKAAELVKMAVDRVPKGNDYIILDRCAGTGNLEASLIGLYDKNGSELISHCVLSTYEYYEYKVLLERLGDKVRDIIPPTEGDVDYANGKVMNADAMSKEFVEKPIIKQYVDNPKCTIIMLENPPYTEASTIDTNKSDKEYKAGWKQSYVIKDMKSKIKTSTNDLCSLFAWSAFEYYLRQETDSIVLYSPLKCYKSLHLLNYHFEKGFIFNRGLFGDAGNGAVSCFLFYNIKDTEGDHVSTEVIEVIDNVCTTIDENYIVKKVSLIPSKLYDKRKIGTEDGIAVGKDGCEASVGKLRLKPLFDDSILGYLVASSFGFEKGSMKPLLTRCVQYNGNGFYLYKDNYKDKLPLFAMNCYPITEKWYEFGTLFKTADGGENYLKDKDFIKSCFIYTCLSHYNKCLSFTGSDGRYYKNELCFDGDTLANKDLVEMKLLPDEEELLSIWKNVLAEAKKIKDYNNALSYGVYQIHKELNTFHQEGQGKQKRNVPDYVELNTALELLKNKLKLYYQNYIKEKMFKYELIK